MSTVSPRASRELAGQVSGMGATMIDAPVSGSVPAAQNGTLSIMAGGPDEAFQAVAPLLDRLGSKVTHVGGNGQGLLLKLAINISLAARAMAASPIGSPMLQARVPLVLDLPEHAWFDMQFMHKDIRLALEAARESGVPLPAATAADSMLSQAEELGYGRRDIAGLFQVLAAT
jgi:3-hydroxyisobutyrate dehydrogenase-like beta-hydroxyacid dehydrogenase